MDEPLDEQYLKWLYRQVASVRLRNPARTYWSLLRHLYSKEFVWLVPNDDNRVEDGRDLREEFFTTQNIEPDPEWMGFQCSILEMLIALSRRASFEANSGSPRDWFWILIHNLDLQDLHDAKYNDSALAAEVDEILDQFIWRTYAFNGRGGLFPLEKTDEDQREVELWYQLATYLLERS